jgi:hypothetical protein
MRLVYSWELAVSPQVLEQTAEGLVYSWELAVSPQVLEQTAGASIALPPRLTDHDFEQQPRWDCPTD